VDILIAEDSPILSRALGRMVQGLGHEVRTAADGLTAWEEFQRCQPEVVISDWVMPGIEGPELCRRIRAAGGAYTYFVFLTVLEEKQNALAGMRAGADDYLTKPVDLDDLQLRLIAAERVTTLHRQLADQAAEQVRVEAALREAEAAQQRSRFMAELSAAEDRLRQQVAELLHGRVQSRLIVAWERLGECQRIWEGEPDRARSLLAEARELIDRIREGDVRRASHMLHPATVQLGLVPAVQALADALGPELVVELAVEDRLLELDDLMEPKVPEPTRLAAYRVVEEALGNVLRHAKARSAAVWLGVAGDGRLGIEVSDDGVGLDPSKLKPGLGLRSIAARVESLGGEWRISGAPGRGTRLLARLPLNSS
jgi:signal transduction histidine kinase